MSNDSTTALFGLAGIAVLRVDREPDGRRVVHARTDDAGAAACPQCGVFSASPRQSRTTAPRDVPFGEDALVVRWHKQQWSCRETACPRKAFTEQIPEIPARARLTGRLRRHVAARVDAGLTVAAACQSPGRTLMSWPIGHAAFVMLADTVLAEVDKQTGIAAAGTDARGVVRVLGIDETRRGRPVWTQDPVTDKWRLSERFETNFVDLSGPGGLLGQAAGRSKATVTGWLAERDQAWKDSVVFVAIDPCASYRAAVREALPHAVLVADHFHLVQLANQAVTDVRRRTVWEQHGRRGRKSDPAWASRRRLLRGRERLSEAQMVKMWNGLMDGDPTAQVLIAWIAKEELRGLLACARTGGQRHEVAARLERFYAWCARNDDLPELLRLARTVEAWWPQILAFLQTRITNAGTEATNRTIKTVARNAYGFRNLDNQRRRVRWACTRQQRALTTC